MSSEKEFQTEITPEEVFQKVLDGQIQYFIISFCSDNSWIKVIGDASTLVEKTGLDYNGSEIICFRLVLQALPGHQFVRVLSERREGIIITRELEITARDGSIFYAIFVSSGISNKYNCLEFTRSRSTRRVRP